MKLLYLLFFVVKEIKVLASETAPSRVLNYYREL
jgi:hypothetical protein